MPPNQVVRQQAPKPQDTMFGDFSTMGLQNLSKPAPALTKRAEVGPAIDPPVRRTSAGGSDIMINAGGQASVGGQPVRRTSNEMMTGGQWPQQQQQQHHAPPPVPAQAPAAQPPALPSAPPKPARPANLGSPMGSSSSTSPMNSPAPLMGSRQDSFGGQQHSPMSAWGQQGHQNGNSYNQQKPLSPSSPVPVLTGFAAAEPAVPAFAPPPPPQAAAPTANPFDLF